MKQFIINKKSTLKDTLKIMDKVSNKVLFVAKNRTLLGTVSDGDIRRSILRGDDLNIVVEKIMNTCPIIAKEDDDIDKLKKLMIQHEIQVIPVLNNAGQIIDIKFWNKLFNNSQKSYSKLSNPVVIMAGGRGRRLEPFTNILPKPLIPIGNKTMIETIIDEYLKYGVNDFHISVNHKSKIIKAYFEEIDINYNISYINEEKPLGTAGSLKFIEGKFKNPIFVSNCDIIIKEDYSNILNFHKKGGYDLTLIASMQHHRIPYGVCKLEKGGELKEIIEKPEYDFLVNTGMYILNPNVLEYIPKDKFYHITHLIADLQKQNKKIGVYPVSEKSWIDIGQWSEYKKNLDLFDSLIRK